MPQNHHLSGGQDWDTVNVGRSSVSHSKAAAPKNAREISMLKAAGVLTTEKRHGSGGNKSAHSGGVMSARKLEEADDVGTIAKVDKSLSKAIMQVRLGIMIDKHVILSTFASRCIKLILSRRSEVVFLSKI